MLIALLTALLLGGATTPGLSVFTEQFAAMLDNIDEVIVDTERQERCRKAIEALASRIDTAEAASEERAQILVRAMADRTIERGTLESMLNDAEAKRIAMRGAVFDRRQALRTELTDEEWAALVPVSAPIK
ncbi:MAG: hypothetical protein Phyf2KO_00850 [Phycisphaerales bacterium]